MLTHTRNWILAGLVALLVACGGGGGGNSAPGVDPGPPPPGQPVPPPPGPPGPSAYETAQVLNAYITSVTLDGDNRPIVEWQLTDGNGTAIVDLTEEDVRFTIAKLQASPLGNLTGTWQSYINRIREPESEEGPGTEDRLQATYERNADGSEFTNNGDGTYRYHFALSLTNLDPDILAQAETESLNLSYEPDQPHRLVMQFGNSEGWANPVYDWVPATGATTGVFSMDIAATANCNRCHDPLAIHGSGRREVKYCVTCHNPGSTDPTSTNTVDFKVMIHKIHMGANLPSVQAGGEYIVGGHDYSNLHYPQDIRNCVNCHAGSATGADLKYPDGSVYEVTQTSQGDNWTQVPAAAACGSCHDGLSEDGFDAPAHIASQDEANCASCHSEGGDPGSPEDSHSILSQEARAAFVADLQSVSYTGPGETPEAIFRVFNPLTGDDYDILDNPVWSRLRVRFAWSTTDYTNTGNQEDDSSSIAADALVDAEPNGDGTYRISSPLPIPDAATGSLVAVIEGRAVVEPDDTRVPLTNVHEFFSIDEPDGNPVKRRQSVTIENCQACHVTISFHGGNRTDNIDSCVTCHNPRNTDRADRVDLDPPPADGLKEQSVDFKVMIHGIHAAGKRETPLQVAETVFDAEEVRFPGDLANCTACHNEDGYKLPLADTVLAPSVDTGIDLQDPSDDIVATPTAAVCSSCHDSSLAADHMTQNGGNFATTQAAIDNPAVGEGETCAVCHGEDREFDVEKVHNVHPKPL